MTKFVTQLVELIREIKVKGVNTNYINNFLFDLQGQVKELSGDLQTARRESVHDRKRVEIKEFEKKLAKAEAKVEMAAQLHNHRADDELDKLKEAVREAESSARKEPARKVVPISE